MCVCVCVCACASARVGVGVHACVRVNPKKLNGFLLEKLFLLQFYMNL